MAENNFKVSVKDVADIYCAAVCGLDNEFDEIAYRAGDSVIYFKPKVTGLRKAGDVTLKDGTCENAKALQEWVDCVKSGTIQRKEVTVSLLDESGCAVQTWTLINAWTKKFAGKENQPEKDALAFDFLLLAHEGVMECSEKY